MLYIFELMQGKNVDFLCRISKPLSQLGVNVNDEDIWMTSLLDRYVARPKTSTFEQMCLADFASFYQVIYGTKTTTPKEDQDEVESEIKNPTYELLNGLGSIKRRQIQAVVRYPKFNPQKNKERYYSSIVRMYYPHRDIEFNLGVCQSFEDYFEKYKEAILENMSKYETLTEELDNAWEMLKQNEFQDEAWEDIAPNQEVGRLEDEEDLNKIPNLHEMEEIESDDNILDLNGNDNESNNIYIDKTATKTSCLTGTVVINPGFDFKDAYQKMNTSQSRLFYFVRQWAIEKKRNIDIDPFHIFLTGGAGTGKSHLVKCLFYEINKILRPTESDLDSPVVLLIAPTGTAAYNIKGQTIHSAFALNKNINQPLSEDMANKFRLRYQYLQLVIIDEISMVSHGLLCAIHSRLQQIKLPSSNSTFFGGVSILAVGDLFQIPPVKGKKLFKGENVLTDPWSLFLLYQLDEVVRQQGDNTFINLLNRIRTKHQEENMNDDDLKLLQSRIIQKDNKNYPIRQFTYSQQTKK